jgi:1,4-alpha-glucan branching enzyme
MRHSRVIHDNRISTTGFRRANLETGIAPRNPEETPETAAEKVNPSPPVQPVSERFPALEEQEITFTVLAPEAREVSVVGSFNGWRPNATPLNNTSAGEWAVRLMLRSGQYEYRFVVDGRWSEDPRASQHVANPFGEFNSVLVVPLAVRTSIL